MDKCLRARKVKELYEQGMDVKDIAEEFSVSDTTIKKDLRSLGVVSRRKTAINANRDMIISMYKEGRSFKDIGQAVGFSYTTVRSLLVEWGYHESAIPVKLEIDENTIFAEERPKVVPCEIYGKKYLDVTEVFCPR